VATRLGRRARAGGAPSARGRGLAAALLAECERLAREVGAAEFAIHTLEFMTAAVSPYQSRGYQRAPEFDVDLGSHYAVLGGPRIRALAYRRNVQEKAA
jgi:GNAT superfamily N-acetyltransferase